jgi:predicted nucleic acid-binding protein
LIVMDASAAVAGLLGHESARRTLAEVPVHIPYLIDSEVVSALRRQMTSGSISAEFGRSALQVWGALGLFRYGAVGLLERVWELRDNLTAYDATYVALAEHLDAPLVTLDARIAGASGVRCEITVLSR